MHQKGLFDNIPAVFYRDNLPRRLFGSGQTMVTAQCLTESKACQVVLSPNNSFSWQQSAMLFGSLSVILLVIGLGFALQGFWMILPFAGLELLTLGVCLVLVSKSSAKRQVITIGAEQVTVEKGACAHRFVAKSGPEVCSEYPRSWTRLNHVTPEHDWYPSRLLIGASGRNVEIGEFLTEDEKLELATQLKRWL